MLNIIYNKVITEGSLNLSPARQGWNISQIVIIGGWQKKLWSHCRGPQQLVWVEFDLLLGG